MDLERFKRDFRAFLSENRWALCVTSFLLTLALFHFLLSDNIRMDSVIKLATPGDEFNDLQLGRFGIVYLGRLTGLRWFSPYFSGYLTMVAILAAGALMGFIAWRFSGGRYVAMACGLPLLIFLTPNWIEQLYFSYQSFQVVLGVILLEAAALLPEYCPRRRWIALEALLAFCAYSVYQSLVALYIALCAGAVLLGWASSRIDDPVELWHRAARHAAAFILALAGYLAVDRLLQRNVTASEYLTGQVLWGSVPIHGIVMNIARAIGSLLTCQGRLDTPLYAISAGFCALFMALRWARRRDHGHSLAILLGWLVLQLSAFAMLIVIGRRTYLRAELAITFVTAFNLCLARLLADQWAGDGPKPWLRRLPAWAMAAAMLVGIYGAGSLCFRLIYTDDVRNDIDGALAAGVVERLRQTRLAEDDKTLVFVGEPEIHLNAGCLVGETIGRSLFNHLNNIENTNHLISNIMAIHGVTYRSLTPADAMEAEQLARNMPCFPETGGVAETDRVVVVKLSEDEYFDGEIIEPGATPLDAEVSYDATTDCHVDTVVSDGRILMIRGANIRRGVPARQVRNDVCLLNRQTGALYRVNTAREQRIQLTNQYWRDGVSYDQGGFIAVCPMSLLARSPEATFEILVRFSCGDGTGFVPTGIFIDKRSLDQRARPPMDGGFMHGGKG